MGLLSSTTGITRYCVEGKLDDPILETVTAGLKKHTLTEIDNDSADKAIGWTCFNAPFHSDFDRTPILFGTYLVFSMRIDKKSIPSKIIQKYYARATRKRLQDSGREFLSQTEKKEIKDQVIDELCLRIPATPNVYDLIWKYESNLLWFFSNLKGANEELETLFNRSFNLKLIRLFPYTMASLTAPLTQSEKAGVSTLTPTRFLEQ